MSPVRILRPRRPEETDEEWIARVREHERLVRQDQAELRRLRREAER